MKISIEYFALLKEQRGRSSDIVETQATDPKTLYSELKAKHAFSLDPESLKVAVNEDFATWDTPLREGDTVVFIPPVAGG